VPTLYILCGLPGAGKTMLATRLAAARDMACVSLEHVKADEGYFMPDDEVPEADWPGIHDVVHASLLMPLRLGRDVIYDAPNLKRSDRDELRELASRRGFGAKVIYVAVPEATRRDGAPAWFEEPSAGEDVIVYAPDQDVSRWIKANFA
jgi:predicted kinase